MMTTLLKLDTKYQNSIYRQIEAEHGKTKDDIDKNVDAIRAWHKNQPYLPEIPGPQLLSSLVLLSKFNVEQTKQNLDFYFSLRKIVPELGGKHPCSSEMIELAKILYIVPLPKLPEDNLRIVVIKFSEKYTPDLFDHEIYMNHAYNVFELLLREEPFLGFHCIIDCDGITTEHTKKLSPMVFKKAALVLEKVFSNRVSFHFTNYYPDFEGTVLLMKTVLGEELGSQIYVQRSQDELFKQFPKEILPKDLGGDGECLAVLGERLIEIFKLNKRLFDDITSIKVDESKRPSELVNESLLGSYGNFRKLDID